MEPDANEPAERRDGPRDNHSLWDGVIVSLLVVGVVVLWPVLLPTAIVLHNKGERRKRECAGTFVCRACGEVLGEASVELADAEWSAYLEEFRREHPSRRFRLVRTSHAICVTCRRRYAYLERENTFVIDTSEDPRVVDGRPTKEERGE